MAKTNFFVKRDNKYYVNVNCIHLYIPRNYFKDEVAVVVGSHVRSIGIFHFGIFANEANTDISKGSIHSLNMPLNVMLNFNNMYNAKLKLKPELDEDEYTVLTLNKGDIFIEETRLIKNIEAVEIFVNKLLHAGKLPKDLKYSDIIQIYHKCLEFNSQSLGVPSLTLESIVSELYRDKKDVSQPFRKRAARSQSNDEYGYEPYSMKKIPALNSTFAAVSFEDMNQAVIDSVKRNREGKPETESPVEKTIHY